MESFVHLRKGTTPRRLHADLDGLKDDELGRGGFTGRTANMYRRNDPTAYRSVGPLRPVDVLASELKPSDATDARGGPLLMFSNADCQVLLSRRSEPMPFFVRYVDGDLLSLRAQGRRPAGDRVRPAALPRGRLGVHPEGVHLPPGARRRRPTLLMIQATDEFRVPPPGTLGRHFPFDPSQAVIPEPAPIDDASPVRRRVRGPADPSRAARQRCSTNIIRSTWRAGAATTSPFTFNIADYNVVTSDSVHLPPTVHLFMQATGVYVMNFLPKPAESVPGTERTPVVSPQRRLRRDRVLPRRLALRHPDAARPDFPCAARGSPRRTREGARAGAPQVRRLRQGRLVGDRHRHPAQAHPVRRGSGQRSGAALMTTD